MNKKDFTELLQDYEIMLTENHHVPIALLIDEDILYSVFPDALKQNVKIVKYKLPLFGDVIPVVPSKPGIFRLKSKKA